MTSAKRFLIYSMATLLAFTLVGCATVFSGTQQEISIRTSPEDARIYVDGRLVGTGSATFLAKKTNGDYNIPEITVEAKGYKSQTFKLQKSFDNTSIINLTFVYSWTTDFLTGAMFEYSPDNYMVQLVEEDEIGFSEEQKFQQFALSNMENLKRDLARGQGEYFATLKVYKPGFSLNNIDQTKVAELLSSENPWDFYLKLKAV